MSIAALISLGFWSLIVFGLAWDEARRERKAPKPIADPDEPSVREFHERQSYDAVGVEKYRDQLRPRVRDV